MSSPIIFLLTDIRDLLARLVEIAEAGINEIPATPEQYDQAVAQIVADCQLRGMPYEFPGPAEAKGGK